MEKLKEELCRELPEDIVEEEGDGAEEIEDLEDEL